MKTFRQFCDEGIHPVDLKVTRAMAKDKVKTAVSQVKKHVTRDNMKTLLKQGVVKGATSALFYHHNFEEPIHIDNFQNQLSNIGNHAVVIGGRVRALAKKILTKKKVQQVSSEQGKES